MNVVEPRALALLALLASPIAGAAEAPVVLQALKTELARSMRVLGEQPEPPYF